MCLSCRGKLTSVIYRGRKLPEWWKKKISDGQKGSKNPNWVGDIHYNYNSLHGWIRANLYKDTKCSNCGDIKNLQFANKSGKYLRDKSDWITLCAKCHSRFDKGTKKRFKWNGREMKLQK